MSDLASLLASLTPKQREGLSWGDRGGGNCWQARWGNVTTIDFGGPYRSPVEAIRAVLCLGDAAP